MSARGPWRDRTARQAGRPRSPGALRLAAHFTALSAALFLAQTPLARARAHDFAQAKSDDYDPVRKQGELANVAPEGAAVLEPVPPAEGPTHVVGQEQISPGRPLITLDEPFLTVPGLFAQNRYNHAQEVRLSIRGYGARTTFGLRGIRIFLDGFPLTLPDGQSQPDGIDVGTVERIEVLRGPLSARYGNAAGGAVLLETAAPTERPEAAARVTAGHHGLLGVQAMERGGIGPARAQLNISRFTLEGHRAHSGVANAAVRAKVTVATGRRSQLTLVLAGLDIPQADDPGGITAEQTAEDPRQASPLSLRYRTSEEIAQGHLGVRYEQGWGEGHLFEAQGFALLRWLKNRVPYRVVDLLRVFSGGGLRDRWRGRWLGRSIATELGLEIAHQADDRQNHESLDGNAGALILDQEERVLGVGTFLDVAAELFSGLTASAGGRYDGLRFLVADQLRAAADRSGRRNFDELSGAAGLRYQPRPFLALQARVAQGFETPTLSELATPATASTGLDPELRPEHSLLLESALTITASEWLKLVGTCYWLGLDDELIRYEDKTTQAYYRNAGRSRRIGAEAELALALGPFALRATYTFMDARFVQHERDGHDFAGHRVPGSPRHQLGSELLWRGHLGERLVWLAGLGARYAGRLYADDESLAPVDSFVLLEARAEAELRLGAFRLSPFLGASNLLDQRYVANVRVNAAAGRFFEPGPGVTVHGGLGLSHLW